MPRSLSKRFVKFSAIPKVLDHFGWIRFGLLCSDLYLIPTTLAVLGAILLTGYLGGAVGTTHMRGGVERRFQLSFSNFGTSLARTLVA